MLRAISVQVQIERSQKRLRSCLHQGLRAKLPDVMVGFQGGHGHFDVLGNNTIWFAYQSLTDREAGVPRHWNAFGAGRPVLGRSNAITVEVNMASPWAGKRAAGLFATDEDSDTVVVLHSGRIGGRAAGESVAFREWYQNNGGEWVRYISPAGREEWAFLVAELHPDRFLGRLESFVVAVA